MSSETTDPTSIVQQDQVVEVKKPHKSKESLTTQMYEQLRDRVQRFKSPHDKRSMNVVLQLAERIVNRESKQRERRPYDGNRKTGFMIKKPVTQNVCDFMGQGTEFSRTELTKEITNYIKSNALQIPGKTSYFRLDNKLAALLQLQEGDELSFTSVQKHLKNCFAV